MACIGNAASSFVQHAVTLGMYCNLSPSPIYFYNDLYFECADDAYHFDKPFDLYGNTGLRYMCSTSATFPVSSTSADSRAIPDVAIVTDDYWLQDAVDECFTISSVPSAPVSAPVSAPLQVTDPTIAPDSVSPVRAPSIQTLLPTVMPALLEPVTSRENPQSNSSDSKSPIGAIAGGIIGGIVIGMLVIGFIMYRKQSNTSNHSPKPNVLDEHTITHTGTVNVHDPSSSSNTGHPVAGANMNFMETGYHSPAPSDAVHVPSTAPDLVPTPQQYEVNYKDQTRTVIGQPQPMPTVDAVLVQTQIPIAVAMDTSGASGGSNTTRSEPPGRRYEGP